MNNDLFTGKSQALSQDMLQALLQENHSLKRRQSILINQARENEQKLQRMQSLEIRLISTNSLYDLILQVLENYRTLSGLNSVTLTLIDPEYELQRILQEENVVLSNFPNLMFFHNEEQLNQLFGLSLFPRLGPFIESTHRFIFPDNSIKLGSIASLPLIRQDKLIGCLNLGSENKERFISRDATHFLERLAAIFSICLENTANHERLKRVGLTDPLTGINNRRFFDQRFDEEISRSKRTTEPLTCLLLDIDYFKKINDNYGHQTGDRVLVDIARIIKSQLRDTDVLARYGGEEFSVLLINTSKTDAQDIAERIRLSVAENDFTRSDEENLKVTLSIGMTELQKTAYLDANNTVCHQLIEQADQALYQAKDSGRNQVSYFEQT